MTEEPVEETTENEDRTPPPVKSELHSLVKSYQDVQEHRIAMNNQVFQLKERGEPHETLLMHANEFHELEKNIKKSIEKAVKKHPMWAWFKTVKGIGPVFAASLVSQIDISKADHASSVWSFCGLAPDQKRKKGEKISWNPDLKRTAWLIGKSFVLSKGEYRKVYDQSKAYYQAKFPVPVKVEGTKIVKYTPGHIDAMSRRRAVKKFLADMWAQARQMEGLPISAPYMHKDDHENPMKYYE